MLIKNTACICLTLLVSQLVSAFLFLAPAVLAQPGALEVGSVREYVSA